MSIRGSEAGSVPAIPGRGSSDIDNSDLSELADMTHRYFFARKFPTENINDESRIIANKFSRSDYYKNLQKYIPQQILYQLMQNGLRYLQLENGTDIYQYDWEYKLDKLYVVPVLQPSLDHDRQLDYYRT